MRLAAFLALMLVGLCGCRAYNSNNPYPSDRPKQSSPPDFPLLKDAINRNVERGSPNL